MKEEEVLAQKVKSGKSDLEAEIQGIRKTQENAVHVSGREGFLGVLGANFLILLLQILHYRHLSAALTGGQVLQPWTRTRIRRTSRRRPMREVQIEFWGAQVGICLFTCEAGTHIT